MEKLKECDHNYCCPIVSKGIYATVNFASRLKISHKQNGFKLAEFGKLNWKVTSMWVVLFIGLCINW